MPIKLNGATNGSVELDVPAAVGSDLQITLPATAGTAIVKAADGSVDLGSVDIDSAGNLGIGTAAPSGKLDILTGTTGNVLIDAEGGSNFHAKIVNDSGDLVVGARSTSADTIVTSKRSTVFKTGSSEDERLRVDSSGRLLVGTSSQIGSSSAGNAFLQIKGRSGGAVGRLTLATTNSNPGANSTIGSIYFTETSGGNYGLINCVSDGTSGTNDYPGRLTFSTTADGAASPTERMRITNGGVVAVNRTTALHGGVFVLDYTNGTSAGLAIKDTNTSGTGVVLHVVNGSGTIVGGISQNQSTTSFNTSSDYRLKENVVDIADGITRVKQLSPKRFNFIADDTKIVDGFIAHEAQTVVPEAVAGTKDEVDADGNAVMQGIDQSKLVPLLTAALQEAITKIETLEARVTTLEAG